MTLRICILEADDLHPSLQETYLGFGDMFKRLFYAQDTTLQLHVFNVVRGEYPAQDQHFDADLVTGSKADSFANDPWIVTLRTYLQERFACGDVLLGICFGHQILALALGGDTQRSDKGWGLGVHNYRLQAKPHWLEHELDHFQLLVSHRDQVIKLPEGAHVLASNEFCEHAAFIVGEQVLCFQGHPEFTADFSRALLQLRESVYCPQEYSAACQSLADRHDGALVTRWMLSFIKAAHNQRNAAMTGLSSMQRASICLA